MDEIAPGVFVSTAEKYTTTTTVVAGDDGGCLLIDPAVSVADLAAFFGGLDLLPPGVIRHGDVLCGVGVKPYPRRPHDAGRPRG